MGEDKALKVNKYGAKAWNLGALGLEMHYADIK